MKVSSSIIASLLLLTVCSCSTPKSEMSTLVNNSLQTATVQSKLMAEDLLNELCFQLVVLIGYDHALFEFAVAGDKFQQ